MKSNSVPAYLCVAACVIFSITGCKSSGGGESEAGILPETSTDEIVVTAEQFESSGMRIGEPERMMFSQTVMANGYITAAPDGRAQISTLVPARVKNVKLMVGDYVEKDDILFTIEGDEIVALQQEYAVVVHELKVAKSDYLRQLKLAGENITSQKDFIKTESDYLKLQATAEGLRSRLSMINLNPDDVEDGKIYPAALITTPIEGFVSDIDIVLGQFIQPGEVVMEIIDPGRFQLNLNLFEKDLVNMIPGQKVIFHDPDNRERIFAATLRKIGKAIDPETKTVLCIAGLAPKDRDEFVNGLYVQAEIITCERMAPAVPAEALIREDDRYFVLSGDRNAEGDYHFFRVPVHIGVITEYQAEVLDTTLHNVLLEGAYNLF